MNSVYVLRDESGAPLYVGCTRNLRTRVLRHRRSQPWGDRICTVESDDYEDYREALMAEREAIHRLNPSMNRRRPSLSAPCRAKGWAGSWFDYYDRYHCGGRLADYLRGGYVVEGLSYRELADRIRDDFDLDVSHEWVRQQCERLNVRRAS